MQENYHQNVPFKGKKLSFGDHRPWGRRLLVSPPAVTRSLIIYKEKYAKTVNENTEKGVVKEEAVALEKQPFSKRTHNESIVGLAEAFVNGLFSTQ